MTDWANDLGAALASGDAHVMKAMLARVPDEVLQRAAPYLHQLAKSSEEDGKLEDALTYYEPLVHVAPDRIEHRTDRARIHLKLDRFAPALADATRVAELAPEHALGHRLQGQAHEGLGELPQAVAAYRRGLRLEPDEKVEQRVQRLETEIRKDAMLRQTLDPAAAQEPLQIELAPPPQVNFDPALFDDPSIPESFDRFRVDGLKQHLCRYSGQQSPRHTLARLEDPVWLDAWDVALSTLAGARVLFRGSELGVFALRALQHGAAHVLCAEDFPLDARITTGMVQKHFLQPWHALHGAAMQEWSDDQRRASFEAFAKDIDVLGPDNPQPDETLCDCLVFPRIDHSLLGTGIVKAVRRYMGGGRTARVLPAKATVFAMGIQWDIPGTSFDLQPVNRLRWSPYPQPLELGQAFWTALTAPNRVGEIDFAEFSETTWNADLPIVSGGRVDAIVFWFELDLGRARVDNAPGSDLQCLKPAVQYTDCIDVRPGDTLAVRIDVRETRLHFQTHPAATQLRSHGLPGWYVPMLGDRRRNVAYREAIGKALASHRPHTVLDIGAGCGLLSMTAAAAGANRVVGCETLPAIFEAGKEIIRLNGLEEVITLVNKDCRNMKVPDDLHRRADLAVFELFDCSLIGEGVLHFLAHAREHLLAENAHYLPAGARIRAMLIEYRLDRLMGIDANLLNPYRFSPSFINVDAEKLTYRALTEPFDLFAFDFSKAGPAPEEKELLVPTIAPGMVGAVIFWFDLQLDETSWISNEPKGSEALHWKQGLQFLPEVRVEDAMQLPLLARHDGSSLKFHWRQDALPREAFSSLPRFDPRWLAASNELEQQTRELLQHCAQNPDEYAKVAEISKRFAIDPATHGLDPLIAQRFASMFFGA